MDELPTVPMFTGKAKSKVKCDSDMGAVLTEMAKSVISVLQPKLASTPPSSPRESTSTISPGKIAELRSKYLQQMKVLHIAYLKLVLLRKRNSLTRRSLFWITSKNLPLCKERLRTLTVFSFPGVCCNYPHVHYQWYICMTTCDMI